MEYINTCRILGKIGYVKLTTVNDKIYAKLSVATCYAYRTQDNLPCIETTWHNVTVPEYVKGLKENNITDLKKGMAVDITGRIRIYTYTDTDGREKPGMEIKARSLSIVGDYDTALECQEDNEEENQ